MRFFDQGNTTESFIQKKTVAPTLQYFGRKYKVREKRQGMGGNQ